MKALVAGVPMVMMPHGRDQPDNARRVSARGAGLTLARNAPPDAIAKAVSEVLSASTYAPAASHMGRQIQAEVENSTLVADLESL